MASSNVGAVPESLQTIEEGAEDIIDYVPSGIGTVSARMCNL